MRFPERTDHPFAPKKADAAQVARRMEAACALAEGRPVVVVASARALLRRLPPVASGACEPLSLMAGYELSDMPGARAGGVQEFEDVARALERRGYANTGELDGPGTFAVRGGTIDVFPGNLVYPVRLDFFGDELDEIRRIVPTTGQTIASLAEVDVYPVMEFACTPEALARARKKLARPALTNPALRDVLEKLEGGLRFDGSDVLLPYLYDQTATLGDYARAKTLSAVVEPRSLFDDATHAYDDLTGRAKGTNVALAGLYAEPSELAFGSGQRATYVSIMRVGGSMDDELPVKRVDVAGHPDKLFGKLRSLVEGGYTVAFSAPNFRARQDMSFALVDNGIPIQETLDVLEGAEDPARDVEGGPEASLDDKAFAKRRLRRGVGQPGGRGHTAGHGHPQGEAGAGVAGRHAGRARCLPHASARGHHRDHVSLPAGRLRGACGARRGLLQGARAARRGRHGARLPAAGIRGRRQAVRACGAAGPRDALRGPGRRRAPGSRG